MAAFDEGEYDVMPLEAEAAVAVRTEHDAALLDAIIAAYHARCKTCTRDEAVAIADLLALRAGAGRENLYVTQLADYEEWAGFSREKLLAEVAGLIRENEPTRRMENAAELAARLAAAAVAAAVHAQEALLPLRGQL